MKRLTSTEVATVSANGRNHSPATPPMKATGMNTAMMEKVVAVTARPISAVPLRAAVMRSSPRSMCRTMFSRTTIASSISTPIASDRPSSVMKLSVKPHSPHRDERRDHRGGQRQRRDQRRAPRVEERVHHEDREPGAEDQRLDHVLQAVLRVLAAVLGDLELGARGQRLVDLVDQLADLRRPP